MKKGTRVRVYDGDVTDFFRPKLIGIGTVVVEPKTDSDVPIAWTIGVLIDNVGLRAVWPYQVELTEWENE